MGRTKNKKLAKEIEEYEPEPTKQAESERKLTKAQLRDPNNFIPTGSTMLNLSLSDFIDGGWQLGRIFNLIGDSSTGKTLLALTTMAEMCQQKRFDKYRLIFDDIEFGCGFDIGNISPTLAKRIEPPQHDKNKTPIYSDEVEDLHDNVLTAIEKGKPFIYVVDSWDALDAADDKKKLQEQRDARKKGTKAKGSYAMAKAKKASHILRTIKAGIAKTNSILIIISQTRDNIEPMAFEEKYRSGGRALKFYSWVEAWLGFIGKITSKKIQIGGNSIATITKNRTNGKKRNVKMAIYDEFGVDDISPILDFLIEWNDGWTKTDSGSIIPQKSFLKGEKMSRERLIRTIEAKNMEQKLREICQKTWDEREEGLKKNRKKRYA